MEIYDANTGQVATLVVGLSVARSLGFHGIYLKNKNYGQLHSPKFSIGIEAEEPEHEEKEISLSDLLLLYIILLLNAAGM